MVSSCILMLKSVNLGILASPYHPKLTSHCWFATSKSFWDEIWDWRKRWNKVVDKDFDKQGNLPITLVLGGHKMNRTLHLPTRILKVYIEALVVKSRWFQQCLSLSRLYPWSGCEHGDGRQGVRSIICLLSMFRTICKNWSYLYQVFPPENAF